ncbi:MAG: putative Ig domain-containing protein [Acidobacteriota bacterium]
MRCILSSLLLLITFALYASAKPHTAQRLASSSRGYSMVLVDANTPAELADARDFIASQGGTIAIILPPHTIYGWITPAVKARILGKHKIRAVHDSAIDTQALPYGDRVTHMAARLYNDLASGRRARQLESNRLEDKQEFNVTRPPLVECAVPRPHSFNKQDFIRNLQSLGAQESLENLSVQPNFWGNTDTMDGNVAVAVFLLESTGAIDPNQHTWNQADQDIALTAVVEGLNWWVEQSRAFNLGRPLQFTIVPYFANNPACQIAYEPILHEGRESALWVNNVMNNLGVDAGDTFIRVASFDRVIRDQNRANWAYSIFIGYNPAPAQNAFADGRASWAYIGGPHVNALFRTYGWDLKRIISHETGHIFYACDEYSQPGFHTCSCSCAPEVRPEAKNGNCESGCGVSTECMMRINELALCAYTAAQIGWTSTVLPDIPTAPAGLVVSASSPTQVLVNWQDTATNEAGFQIERKGGSDANFSLIGTAAANLTSFADNTVAADTIYTYRVRAFNVSGASGYSSESSVRTPATSTNLSISTADLSEATVNVPYSRTLSASGGLPPYRWLVDSGTLPPGISLSQFGDLSGTPTSAGTFNFVARVNDTANNSVTKAFSLVVKAAAVLTITTKELPRGSVGTSYSQQLGASGGQTPYTWTIQSGSLPEGLTLTQTGNLQGTPERAGTSSFTLKLTDATSATTTTTLSLVINPATLLLTIQTVALPDGVVGETYSQTLIAAGGSSPYRWALKSGELPNGLTLSANGIISGTPTSSGEKSFEIEAIDQSGQRAIKQFEIDVDPPPEFTILTQSALKTGAVGVPFRVELQATSGTEPYVWKKKKKAKFGTLPDGITVSKEGILSGTPTAQGTYNFTLLAIDAADRVASKPFTLEIAPPPPPLEIRTTSLPAATQGLPYNGKLEANGGVAPYAWSLDSGSLPNGLTLSESGDITGRATAVFTANFVVRLRDAIGTSSTKALSITVVPPPPPLAITTTSLPETSAERAYNQSLQATGGVPPYTWSIANGSLGAGLNLSASGTISGTPTAPGTAVFGVRVTDSAQQTTVRTLAIKINPADRLAPFGVFETPDHKATLTGTITGTGWALDNVGVVAIDILIDNQKVAEADYGIARPDVAVAWGSFPNGANAGFRFSLDTTKLANGDHTLAVRFADAQGNTVIVGARTIQVQNRLLAITTTDLVRGKKGESYSFQLGAADGRPPYTWTLTSGALPQGLNMNASGVISGTPTVAGSFTFGVRVNDTAGGVAVASLILFIQPDIEPLNIVSRGDLAAGLTGVDYAYQLLFAGGTAPRTWSMASGNLPPGLSLGASSGVISGKPTQVGNYTFTLRLTDATSTTVTSQPLNIAITPGPLVITSSGTLTQGTAGSAYTYQLTFLGGQAPMTWSLSSGASLPPGLSLNATTGVINGTPTTPGTYTFTVQVGDSQQPPVSVTSGTLTIVIVPAPLVITSSGTLTGGRINQAYTHQLTFTGGTPPVTWSLPTGSTLPPGLTLNTTTGVISGTPTQTGNFSFTVRITDSANVVATSSALQITISP